MERPTEPSPAVTSASNAHHAPTTTATTSPTLAPNAAATATSTSINTTSPPPPVAQSPAQARAGATELPTARTPAVNPAIPVDATKKSKWRKQKARTVYPLHRSRWVVRAIAFLAEFISFFIIVGMSASCRQGFCSDPFELIFVGIPMIWNIAEFITLCVNGKGIHPGAHIALDLILFGLLVGPGSLFVTAWSSWFDDGYDYDCSGSGPCQRVFNTRRMRYRASGITAGVFELIAGLIHLALFIMACISVHRWRRARRDAQFAALQAAYRQPPPGAISIAGNMDPNLAYLVTYPDGRQVLVPPTSSHQQNPQMSQHSGYYAPQPQYGMPAGQHQTMSSPPQGQFGTQPGRPIQIAALPPGAATAGSNYSSPQQQQASRGSVINHSPETNRSVVSDATSYPQHPYQPTPQAQTPQTAQTHTHGGSNVLSPTSGRDSLYEPKSAVEAPTEGTTPRVAEAVPFRN